MNSQGQASRHLDLSAERVWPPARVQLLDGWRCRLDQGVTRRANSVLAVDWIGDDLAESLINTEELYQEHHLTPCFQITPAAEPPELDRVLRDRGYGSAGHSLVQRGDVLARWKSADLDPELRLTARAGAGWRATLQAGGSHRQGQAKGAILARVAGPCGFVALGPAAAPDAIGVGIQDGAAVWVNSMYTRPQRRGRGLARRLLTAIACWAAKQGAATLMLQVEADNTPARRLYEGFGFAPLYPYHYRSFAGGETMPGTTKAERLRTC